MRHSGGMYMSAEAISLILVTACVLIPLGGGFVAGLAWLLRRRDELMDNVNQRFNKVDERFAKLDERFAKLDERFDKVDEQISTVRAELNEVKVAVARLEGPPPRLIFPR